MTRAGELGARAWLAARFGGMTPLQQLSQAFMVTPRELKAAKGDMLKALAVKARTIAKELAVDNAQAFAMVVAGQKECMPYLNAKVAPEDLKPADDKTRLAPMVNIADAQGVLDGGLAGDGGVGELDHSELGLLEENQPLSLPAPGQVGRPKSDASQQTLI